MNKKLESIYKRMLVDGFNDKKGKYKNGSGLIFGRDENGYTMLHYAVNDGNINATKQLIMLGACPFIYNSAGMTPLCNAAGCNNVSVLKFLLKRSCFGLLEYDRAELMAIAASKGKYKNLEFMLKNGFDCNVCYRGDTILYWAMQSARLDVTRLLCEHGADVNAANDEGSTPIFDAASVGLTDIIEYLINQGACIDKPRNDGDTPLILASCYNQIDAVKILLLNKCNIEAKTMDGATALLYAIDHGHVELVQLLLDSGADKSIVDNKNKGINIYCNRIKYKHLKSKMKEILHL